MLLSLLFAFAASPWSPAEWRINLNFGREPGTCMPEQWGASGARLVLPVEILVESSEAFDQTTERDFMGGAKSDRLSVLEDPVFVGLEGQKTVQFADNGAWKIATRRTGKPGDAGKLKFWLDVKSDAQRNDVTVAAERLYCTANCWRESELQIGLRRMRPIEAMLREAQAEIDQRLSHETGDRRLDGKNPVDTAMASIDMAVLVKTRDDRQLEFREAERRLPCGELSKAGNWPGSTEKLIVKQGKIGVKRKNSGILGGEEFYTVGTWTATPLEEGVYEYYDEDDEEEVPPA